MSGEVFEPASPEPPGERKARLLDALRRGHKIGGMTEAEIQALRDEVEML